MLSRSRYSTSRSRLLELAQNLLFNFRYDSRQIVWQLGARSSGRLATSPNRSSRCRLFLLISPSRSAHIHFHCSLSLFEFLFSLDGCSVHAGFFSEGVAFAVSPADVYCTRLLWPAYSSPRLIVATSRGCVGCLRAFPFLIRALTHGWCAVMSVGITIHHYFNTFWHV